MSLDTNTPTGLAFRANEALAILRWEARFPGLRISHTPLRGAAPVDCVGFVGDEVALVAEMKCRTETMEYFAGRATYLITFQKILDLATAAKLLGVPGCLAVYSIPDRELRVATVCDCFGELQVKLTLLRSETQATCNGGTANRLNAYIDWRHFKEPCPL